MYFFRDVIADIAWHDNFLNQQIFLEISKKIHHVDFFKIECKLLTCDVSNDYYGDGTYRQKIQIGFSITDRDVFIKLNERHNDVAGVFSNVIYIDEHNVYTSFVLKDVEILKYEIFDAMQYGYEITLIARNFIKIDRSFENSLNDLLSKKKIDSSFYPYTNQEDFFLL